MHMVTSYKFFERVGTVWSPSPPRAWVQGLPAVRLLCCVHTACTGPSFSAMLAWSLFQYVSTCTHCMPFLTIRFPFPCTAKLVFAYPRFGSSGCDDFLVTCRDPWRGPWAKQSNNLKRPTRRSTCTYVPGKTWLSGR